jgi:hypothetical protein
MGLPGVFKEFFIHSRTLGFDEAPHYQEFINSFEALGREGKGIPKRVVSQVARRLKRQRYLDELLS